ncbi:MAG: SpoIID/LytB domain-containing protein [Bacteroidia bacterium]
MRFLSIILFLAIKITAVAGEIIKVGLFTQSVISELNVSCRTGELKLTAGSGISFYTADTNVTYKCIASENSILVYINQSKIGEFKSVTLEVSHEATCFLKPGKPDLRGNNYTGKIILNASNNRFSIVNEVLVNEYLTGVLRGEIGFDKPPVVYEVHAIISRTYARRFGNKHAGEGFNVCDQTHCQVFKGYFNYEPYLYSIQITEDEVMVDSASGELAEGLFHSNCGGITANSEDVWSARLPYCRSRIDTFCLTGNHAVWSVEMPSKDFFKKINLSESNCECDEICFYSDKREEKIKICDKVYDAITLRNLLKLKSAYFTLECADSLVTISGRGFGHGVGLCQEGAINMAASCFSAEEIIRYYYKDIALRKNSESIP